MVCEEPMNKRYITCSQCNDKMTIKVVMRTWKGQIVCNDCYRKNMDRNSVRNVRYD